MKSLLSIAPLTLIALSAGSAFGQSASPAQSANQDANIRSYVEMLRSDLRNDKVTIVTHVMQLNDADGAKFWPIYREYEGELAKLGDERVTLIKNYAEHYDTLDEKTAHDIATKALDIESRRTALRKKYFGKIEKATSSRVAARFFQVDNQLTMLVDLQVAAALPIVK
jgi:hypothetical protein